MYRPRTDLVPFMFLFAVIAQPVTAEEVWVPLGSGAVSAAVAAANPGDTLFLTAGTYPECVDIAKAITIDGGAGAHITGCGKGSVVTVSAGATVRGLTISGSGSSAENRDAGIKLEASARGAEVSGNTILGNLIGIDIHGAPDALVKNNVIEGRRDHRMNDRGNGVYVWNAPGSRVEDNDIRWGRDGIFVNTSERNSFVGNRFRDLRFAVHYMYAHDSEVRDNVSESNHLGYAIMYSKNVEMRGNLSRNDRDYGIMLNYTNDSLISGNTVQAAEKKCVFIYNAHKNRLTANRFQNCEIGIHFTAGSEWNRISENAFLGNRTQVKYVGSKWVEWSENERGNFWSDHAAYDLNGDGIAESPYRPNDAIDRVLWTQPTAKMLLGSPAVQLIRWSQSAFPALLPGGVVDHFPLMRVHVPAGEHDGGAQ